MASSNDLALLYVRVFVSISSPVPRIRHTHTHTTLIVDVLLISCRVQMTLTLANWRVFNVTLSTTDSGVNLWCKTLKQQTVNSEKKMKTVLSGGIIKQLPPTAYRDELDYTYMTQTLYFIRKFS